MIERHAFASDTRQRAPEVARSHRPDVARRWRRSAPPPAPGDVLDGRLQVTRHLGAGGESEVFAAWDRVCSAAVAVKVARDEDLDAAIERLRAEVLPLNEVRHPHLVRLLDARVVDARCFLVLEALDPRALSERVQRAPLPPAEVVRVVSQVAAALAALHRAGWVHGDVKAENILFAADGRAVLTDLGLARHPASEVSPRSSCCGTPGYMAPELTRGAAVADWFAVDQYALAVTAYLALTGMLPYAGGNNLATLFAHHHAPIPRASDANPELARFDEVLARGLAKDPARRYRSVGEFAAAMRRAFASPRA